MTNSLSGLRSYFRPWARDLVSVAATAGLNPRVTSTLRSYTYQARLYRDYLAGRNEYPVAPPGSSAHELGLAFDMVVYPMSALSELGRVWEDWGGVWGGRFGDEVHFEFPGAAQHAVRQHHVVQTVRAALTKNQPSTIEQIITPGAPGPLGWILNLLGIPSSGVVQGPSRTTTDKILADMNK